MNSNFLFQTGKNKNYFYSLEKKQFLFCHPVLKYLVESFMRGDDIHRLVKTLGEKKTDIPDFGIVKKKVLYYYYKKFLWLMKNGYFSTPEENRKLFSRIDEKDIITQLANTRQVTFEITDACNLNCEYCGYGTFYHTSDTRENNYLDPEVGKTLLNFLSGYLNSSANISHKRKFYISFYGGEPLMNFKFIKEIVEYAKTLKFSHNSIAFSMTTNALLLDKYQDFLVDNGIYLLVSLDGDEGNNSYRIFHNGQAAYEKILPNVLKLKESYPEYFKNFVNFNAVLHNRNSVSGIYNYFKTHFNKIPTIGELNTIGIKDSQKAEFRKAYRNFNESLSKSPDINVIEEDMFIKLQGIQSLGIFLNTYCWHVFKNYNSLLYSADNDIRLPSGTCFPFSKKIFVTVKGKLLPCERIDFKFSLGQVNRKNMNLSFAKIVEIYNNYFDSLEKQCGTCFSLESCEECVFHMPIDKGEPKCRGYMTHKRFSEHLSGNISAFEKKPELYDAIMREVIFD